MRTITYKCDRCGKAMTGRSAVKITLGVQRGVEPVEKSTHDFCARCMLAVNKAVKASMENYKDGRQEEEPAVQEPAARESILQEPTKIYHMKSDITETQDRDKTEEKTVQTGIVHGVLSAAERDMVLKLYVEQGLDSKAIAKELNRNSRGVTRCINTAIKSGEMDRLREEYESLKAALIEEDINEDSSGSGASNAGVKCDSYTKAPHTEVIEGKRYDIGGVLALARAGWPVNEIAAEKHYEVEAVAHILEQYGGQ